MGGVTPLILEKNEGEGRAWRPIEGAAGSYLDGLRVGANVVP